MKMFLAITVILIFNITQTTAQSPTPRPTLNGSIVSVEGGNTFTLLVDDKKTRVPLLAIGAPTQAFGKDSRENLKRLILGKQVKVLVLTPEPKREKKDFIVGKVTLDNQDIGLEQIRGGFAWHSIENEQYQSPEDRKLYAESEQIAKQLKHGIWSDSFKDCRGATVATNINAPAEVGEGGKRVKVFGTAIVEVTINESGDVVSARALCGHPTLQTSAVEAALQWKFKPPGQKIVGTLTINFAP